MICDTPVIEGWPRPPVRLDLSSMARTSVGKEIAKGGLGAYEPEMGAALFALLDVHGIGDFLDIGANVGIFSILVKAGFGDDVQVRAFEPLPTMADQLEKLSKANRISFDLDRTALSSRTGKAQFYVSSKSDSSSSLNPKFRQPKDIIEVDLETLDAFSARHGIGNAVLKIDTESTEPDVLAGGKDYIARYRPWMAIEVLAGRTEVPLPQWAQANNYLTYHLNGDPRMVRRPWPATGPMRTTTGCSHLRN